MPKRTNEFQQLVGMIQRAFAPAGAQITESAMDDSREIDVLMELDTGLYRLKIAVEAKDEKRPLDVEVIELYIGKYSSKGSLNVNQVVIVSRNGFTKGAIERASTVNFALFTLNEIDLSDWTKLVPQNASVRMFPHLYRARIIPGVQCDSPDPLLDGRYECIAHGHDQGSPLQRAEWILRTQIIGNPANMKALHDEAAKLNGTIMASLELPMDYCVFSINGKKHATTALKLDFRYASMRSQVKWSSYAYKGQDGSSKRVDKMESVFGQTKMQLLFPDGLKSSRLALKIENLPHVAQEGAHAKESELGQIPINLNDTKFCPKHNPIIRPLIPYSPNEEKEPQVQKRRKPIASANNLKVGRNTPCPCGSGKKFKNCCIKIL